MRRLESRLEATATATRTTTVLRTVVRSEGRELRGSRGHHRIKSDGSTKPPIVLIGHGVSTAFADKDASTATALLLDAMSATRWLA